jgi:hypothetical protein
MSEAKADMPVEKQEPSDRHPALLAQIPAAAAVVGAVMMDRGGRIGPTEYRSGSAPGATADVNDETGRLLDRGLYTTWVLKRGATEIRTCRAGACRGGGFTMFSFESDSVKTPGTYSLTVNALSDGGTQFHDTRFQGDVIT